MKHLKHIKERFESEDYYTELIFSEYHELKLNSNKNRIYFKKRNIKYLMSVLKNIPYDLTVYHSSIHIKDITEEVLDKVNDIHKAQIIGQWEDYYFSISEIEDDYFIANIVINYVSKYYKCDQIEGVIKLLKDMKII